jgi:hypothetical protein
MRADATGFIFAAVLGLSFAGFAEASPILQDNFQGDTAGNPPSGPSYIVAPTGTDARVVDSSTTPADPFGGAGNHSLMLFDDLNATGASTVVGYNFANMTTAGRLTIDFVLEKNATWNQPYTQLRFMDNDGDNTATVPEIGPWILLNGANNPTQATSARVEALEFNGTGTSFVATTFAITYNAPHTLVLDFDLAADNYTMTLDGNLLQTGGATPRSVFNFYTAQSEINNFEALTAASTRIDSRVFYDNINVVPEPASATLLALSGLAGLRRRRVAPEKHTA